MSFPRTTKLQRQKVHAVRMGIRFAARLQKEAKMAIPDHMLNEPPDPGWCDTHSQVRPCVDCLDMERDRQYDERTDSNHATRPILGRRKEA